MRHLTLRLARSAVNRIFGLVLAALPCRMSPSRGLRDHTEGANVDKEIVKRIVDEANDEEANLIIWDKRDTFTVEPQAEISVEDDYLRVQMEDGKATVYVEYDSIYKLVVEKERTARSGTRAGFGGSFG